MIRERDLPEAMVLDPVGENRITFPVFSRFGGGEHMPVRIFYDTEFLEDGRTIDLISIGMVVCEYRPDRHQYEVAADFYAVNRDAPWDRIAAHPWLRGNVLPSLPGSWQDGGSTDESIWRPDESDQSVHPLADIAPQVEAVITAGGEDVELWAWYGAYDHVALCQLWGAMIDKPKGVPMHTNDLKQEANRQGVTLPDQPSGEHNALEDARYNVVRARALGVIW